MDNSLVVILLGVFIFLLVRQVRKSKTSKHKQPRYEGGVGSGTDASGGGSTEEATFVKPTE